MQSATNGNVIINLGLSDEAFDKLKTLTNAQFQAAVNAMIAQLKPDSAEANSLRIGTQNYISENSEEKQLDVFVWETHVLNHYNSQVRPQIDPLTAFVIGYAIGMTVALALS